MDGKVYISISVIRVKEAERRMKHMYSIYMYEPTINSAILEHTYTCIQ